MGRGVRRGESEGVGRERKVAKKTEGDNEREGNVNYVYSVKFLYVLVIWEGQKKTTDSRISSEVRQARCISVPL